MKKSFSLVAFIAMTLLILTSCGGATGVNNFHIKRGLHRITPSSKSILPPFCYFSGKRFDLFCRVRFPSIH